MKVRGFRIEPGEIQAALERCEGVGRAAVVVREDSPGVKRLVAYLVGDGLDVEAVRAEVAGVLPEYMVPSAFVVLDALPLTANGKVDRRALPEPEAGPGVEYVAPRTEAERLLCDIWAEVLKAGRIGVHDNFFALGGDSISSLQVVSRARRAGLTLSSRDVFLRQTVAELAPGTGGGDAVAAGADDGRQVAEQGTVSGPVGPTPIREWFFATHPHAPGHFAMSMAYELAVDTGIPALRSAVAALLEQHDVLRSVFVPVPGEDRWASEIRAEVDLDEVFTVHGLADTDQPESVWQELVCAAQSGMELERGPLVRVVVGDRGPGRPAWLLLVVHHLLVDGVSWRVLLEDLEAAYRCVVAGEPVWLGEKSSSVRQWSQRLVRHVAEGGFDGQVGYW
ncbi:condensation domain-containing protein, partial [Streptomyces cacaoi]